MPQIDLGPLFRSPDRPQRSTHSSADAEHGQISQPSGFLSRIRISGPQLANLAFVSAACVGALFSAAYLFKGDELLHEVAAWPRELFSGRAATIAEVQADKQDTDAPGVIAPPGDDSAASTNASGDPFSTSRKLLGLDSSAPSIVRPNGGLSLPFSSSPPLTASDGPSAGTAGSSSTLINSVPTAPQSGSIVANNVGAAARAVAGTAGQTASRATPNSIATRSANRASNVVRATGARRAARASNIRSARPSAFQKALTAITRSLRAPKAAQSKSTPAGSVRAQNKTLGRANHARLVSQKGSGAHRSRLASKTRPAAKLFGMKTSVKAPGSRNAQRSSRIAARSTVAPRSTLTTGSQFSRAATSSIRGVAPSGISGSAGALRSFGSMGGHGFGGGGGGRMGLGGGHGVGRGR